MEVKEEHKKFLRDLGLKDNDFNLFEGELIKYEYDEKKGVRIYDPYYATSYNEYIDVDGWSSWSTENNTFMSDILKGAQDETRRREGLSPKPDQKEIAEALQKKFGVRSVDIPK